MVECILNIPKALGSIPQHGKEEKKSKEIFLEIEYYF